MKKLLIILSVVLCSMQLFASHVVGGDISVIWVSQNVYKIKVQVFRDCNASALNTLPSSVTVGIYKIGSNSIQSTETINKTSENLMLNLGDACYTPADLCVDEGIYISNNITIPDNAAGYYLSTQLYARSGAITNLNASGSTGMTFFAEMPDPSLGQNSSPGFGSYPLDSYLCITGEKEFNFNVIDPDGDSLVYSLVNPMGSVGTSNGTQSGSGAYPYYPSVNWAGGFSLANICGGTTPMAIDNLTGLISASPNALGIYVFSVRVEEYRNGVKIGEVRRDVQYAALGCLLDTPPVIELEDTVDVYVSDIYCVDVLSSDVDGTDTINTELSSTDLDLQMFYVAPDTLNGDLYYENFNQNDTLWISYLDSTSTALQGVGEVPSRFCWTPTCIDIDSTYLVSVLSYSLGCAGSDTVARDILFQVVPNPAPAIDFNNGLDTVNVYVLNDTCFDIMIENTVNMDTLVVFTSSNGIDLPANYVAPGYLNDNYFYENFANNDTLWFDTVIYDSPNSSFTSFGTTPIRYCWTPDCNELDSTFMVHIDAYTLGCAASDTSTFDFIINTIFDPSPITNIAIDTVEVNALSEACFDVLIQDSLTSDSLVVSLLFDNNSSNNNIVAPDSISGRYFYEDFLGQDTVWFDYYQYNNSSDNYSGVNLFPIRYCYTPSCAEVSTSSTLSVYSETTGCGAANTTETSIVINVIHEKAPELFVADSDTAIITVDQTYCLDILAKDSVSSDVLNIINYSSIPNFNSNLVSPSVLNGELYYTNFLGEDTVWTENFTITNDTIVGVSQMALRFCITPTCNDIDSVYNVFTVLESKGCGPSTFLYDTTTIIVVPPSVNIGVVTPADVLYTLNEETCFDVLAVDYLSYGRKLTLSPENSLYYEFTENHVEPSVSNGVYYYENFANQDTLWIANYSQQGDSYSGTNYVPARFCFTPDCEDLLKIEYDLTFKASMNICGIKEISNTTKVNITPQDGEVNPVPNVFTPNGDEENDVFTLSGTNDPCFDVMKVEIFNRWGRKVFESEDPLFVWDGTNKNGVECAGGVYYVIIDGTYGSQYDNLGNRSPNIVRDQFSLYLMR